MKICKLFLPILFAGMFLAHPNQLSAQSSAKNTALETIGMQGGLVLYNTYALIGTIHDGYVKDAWTKETSMSLLNEQITMMSNMSAQYDTLRDSKFLSDPSDIESLATIKKGTLLLKREASALKDYIDDPSDENRNAYNNLRDDAWKLISDFLGLK